MAIQTNAQRVQRIYRGTDKVFQDPYENFLPLTFYTNHSGTAGLVLDKNDPTQAVLVGSFSVDGTMQIGETQNIGEFDFDKKISDTSLQIIGYLTGNTFFAKITNNVISVNLTDNGESNAEGSFDIAGYLTLNQKENAMYNKLKIAASVYFGVNDSYLFEVNFDSLKIS